MNECDCRRRWHLTCNRTTRNGLMIILMRLNEITSRLIIQFRDTSNASFHRDIFWKWNSSPRAKLMLISSLIYTVTLLLMSDCPNVYLEVHRVEVEIKLIALTLPSPESFLLIQSRLVKFNGIREDFRLKTFESYNRVHSHYPSRQRQTSIRQYYAKIFLYDFGVGYSQFLSPWYLAAI